MDAPGIDSKFNFLQLRVPPVRKNDSLRKLWRRFGLFYCMTILLTQSTLDTIKTHIIILCSSVLEFQFRNVKGIGRSGLVALEEFERGSLCHSFHHTLAQFTCTLVTICLVN